MGMWAFILLLCCSTSCAADARTCSPEDHQCRTGTRSASLLQVGRVQLATNATLATQPPPPPEDLKLWRVPDDTLKSACVDKKAYTFEYGSSVNVAHISLGVDYVVGYGYNRDAASHNGKSQCVVQQAIFWQSCEGEGVPALGATMAVAAGHFLKFDYIEGFSEVDMVGTCLGPVCVGGGTVKDNNATGDLIGVTAEGSITHGIGGLPVDISSSKCRNDMIPHSLIEKTISIDSDLADVVIALEHFPDTRGLGTGVKVGAPALHDGFAMSTTVLSSDGSTYLPMKDVEADDEVRVLPVDLQSMVLSDKPERGQILTFAEFQTNTTKILFEFTVKSGKSMRVTPNHYVFVKQRQPGVGLQMVAAINVSASHLLPVWDEHSSKVSWEKISTITITEEKGTLAPIPSPQFVLVVGGGLIVPAYSEAAYSAELDEFASPAEAKQVYDKWMEHWTWLAWNYPCLMKINQETHQASIVSMMKWFFEVHPHDVTAASDSEEFLKQLKATPADMVGSEHVALVRAFCPDLVSDSTV